MWFGPDHRAGTEMSWAAVFLAIALLIGARIRRGSATAPRPAGSAGEPAAATDRRPDGGRVDLRPVRRLSDRRVGGCRPQLRPLPRRLHRHWRHCCAGPPNFWRSVRIPQAAWSGRHESNAAVPQDKNAEALLRSACRSAASGSALADGVAELAAQTRHDAATSADAGCGTRSSVLVAGPLGLLLPAPAVPVSGCHTCGRRPGRMTCWVQVCCEQTPQQEEQPWQQT